MRAIRQKSAYCGAAKLKSAPNPEIGQRGPVRPFGHGLLAPQQREYGLARHRIAVAAQVFSGLSETWHDL